MTLVRIVLCVLSLTLAGCATPTAQAIEGEVFIAPGLRFTLPSWSMPERPVEATQILSGRSGDKSFSFQVHLSLNEQRLKVVGIDAFGRRAFDIIWDDSGILANRAFWLPEAVTARNVLADMVIAFWPRKVVKSALTGDAVTVLDIAGRREVNHVSGKAVIVTYDTDRLLSWNREISLSNIAFNYELTIQSAEVKP